MAEIFFPPTVSFWYKAVKTPIFKTIIRESYSGLERRLSRYSSPRWKFTLPIGHMYGDDMELLAGFAAYLGVDYDHFYFVDPMNKQTDLEIGTGDGVETSFRLFRDFGDENLHREYPQFPSGWDGGGYGMDGWMGEVLQGYGVPIVESPYIYLDGVLQQDGYSIGTDGTIEFETPPGVGVAVTATYNFCYKARFTDEVDFSHDFFNGWSTSLAVVTLK